MALPLLEHPHHGPVLVVSARASVNAHTHRRMSHAGDLVLLGGALEPGEPAVRAALRELREETQTVEVFSDEDFHVAASLGHWITESGYSVEGFLVLAPSSFALAVQPDPREVQQLIYLRLDDVYAAPPHVAPHPVHVRDRSGVTGPAVDGRWLFESPTLHVIDTSGIPRMLWGAAGYMVTRLRKMFPTTDRLLAPR